VQDAEDRDAGLNQKFPVAVEETASTRRPVTFLEHHANLSRGAKRTSRGQLTVCLEREKTLYVAEESRCLATRQRAVLLEALPAYRHSLKRENPTGPPPSLSMVI
jgi:hypothetical protein